MITRPTISFLVVFSGAFSFLVPTLLGFSTLSTDVKVILSLAAVVAYLVPLIVSEVRHQQATKSILAQLLTKPILANGSVTTTLNVNFALLDRSRAHLFYGFVIFFSLVSFIVGWVVWLLAPANVALLLVVFLLLIICGLGFAWVQQRYTRQVNDELHRLEDAITHRERQNAQVALAAGATARRDAIIDNLRTIATKITPPEAKSRTCLFLYSPNQRNLFIAFTFGDFEQTALPQKREKDLHFNVGEGAVGILWHSLRTRTNPSAPSVIVVNVFRPLAELRANFNLTVEQVWLTQHLKSIIAIGIFAPDSKQLMAILSVDSTETVEVSRFDDPAMQEKLLDAANFMSAHLKVPPEFCIPLAALNDTAELANSDAN